jgi:ribA/ribD-fused uncharacterized protein
VDFDILKKMTQSGIICFWRPHELHGEFSQWYKSPFVIDNITYSCAEQYMMYQKAILFGDTIIALKILATEDPKTMKAYGRKVRGYDEAVWCRHRERIIEQGNIAKFTQNAALCSIILSTGSAILAEASPYDNIWGIGMSVAQLRSQPQRQWGQNLLGKALMRVRDKLRQRQ